MLVSGGYPEQYEKGKLISGCEDVDSSIVFHAGTATSQAGIVTNGGRVIALTSFGDNFKEAVSKSLLSASKINFDKKYFRKDIGFDL
jgi:phosphoribosylamine--glycine ligase